MAEDKKPHDLEAHPWLFGFEKKDDKDKLEIVVEQLKHIENLVGTISVIVFTGGVIVLTLMIISLFTGKFDLGLLTSIFKLFGLGG